MMSTHTGIEQLLRDQLKLDEFNDATVLNSAPVKSNLEATEQVIETLLEDCSVNIRNLRHEIASPMMVKQLKELGNVNQKLDKRLQNHIQKLRKNEGSLVGTSDVLEFDAAKSRSDRLVEVIQARNVWESSLRVVDLMGESEQNELFGYLVTLQQANQVLRKYVPSIERDNLLEKRKDLFLSWFSSAVLFAIDAADVKTLQGLKERFDALDRSQDFQRACGAFVKNKVDTFMTENEEELTVWRLLDELFNIWKRLDKVTSQFLEEDGSNFIACSIYEGVNGKEEVVRKVVARLVQTSADTFEAAKELSKLKKDFMDYAKSEGDVAVQSIMEKICDDLYDYLNDDLAKHMKSLLFVKIDEIVQAFNARPHKNHDWVMPHLEQVHSSMRNVVNEAVEVFGPKFSKFILPVLEKSVEQLNHVFRKSDLLGLKTGVIKNDGLSQEDVNDKLTCICMGGYLLNMVDDVNSFISESQQTFETLEFKDVVFIRAKQSLTRYTVKVVQHKIFALAKMLSVPMVEEIDKLLVTSPQNDVKVSLPSFSITPHNYITTVGHGLLTQMNNIAAYNTERNFKAAVHASAGEDYNEDECDLWILKGVATLVLDELCTTIGDPTKLSVALNKQLNVDIVFLMEALEDLRLQPTSALTNLAEKVSQITAQR